jgi:hypothetical protein
MPEVQIRVCKNKRCPAFEIPMEFAHGKKCGICSHKTEYVCMATPDTPPADYIDKERTVKGFLQESYQSYQSNLHLMAGEPEPETKQDEPLTLESNCDIKGSCPLVTAKSGAIVRVPFPLYQKWVWLAKRFKVEWIAYLTGKLMEDGAYALDADGMYFPNQLASGVTVRPEALQTEKEGTIATIHSHVDMQAYFSTTDYDHFNRDIELVVNSSGVIDCMTRLKLRCGEFQRVRSRVEITEAGSLTQTTADLKEKLIIEKDYHSGSHTPFTSTSKGTARTDLPAHYSRQGPSMLMDKAKEGEEQDEFNFSSDVDDTGNLFCSHGIRLAHPCPRCRRHATTSRLNSDDSNPTDVLVKAALKVIDRRVKHDGGVDLRTLLDTQQDQR